MGFFLDFSFGGAAEFAIIGGVAVPVCETESVDEKVGLDVMARVTELEVENTVEAVVEVKKVLAEVAGDSSKEETVGIKVSVDLIWGKEDLENNGVVRLGGAVAR